MIILLVRPKQGRPIGQCTAQPSILLDRGLCCFFGGSHGKLPPRIMDSGRKTSLAAHRAEHDRARALISRKHVLGRYLDEKGHTHWTGLSEYSSAQECLDFVTRYPGALYTSDFRTWVRLKIALNEKLSQGIPAFSINGVPEVPSEERKSEALKELRVWREVSEVLKVLS